MPLKFSITYTIYVHPGNQQVYVQLPTYADNVALPAFTRSDQYLLPAGPTAANLKQRVCWDRRVGTVTFHNMRALQCQ